MDFFGKALIDLHKLEEEYNRPPSVPFKIVVFDPKNIVPPPPTREEFLGALVDKSASRVEEMMRNFPENELGDNCDLRLLAYERDALIESQKNSLNVGKQSSQLLLMSPRDAVFGIPNSSWATPSTQKRPLESTISPEEGRILELLSQQYFFSNGPDAISDWVLFRPKPGMVRGVEDPKIGVIGRPRAHCKPAGVVGLFSKPDPEEEPSMFVSVLDTVPPPAVANETDFETAVRFLSAVLPGLKL
jgi:hypothetical protein